MTYLIVQMLLCLLIALLLGMYLGWLLGKWSCERQQQWNNFSPKTGAAPTKSTTTSGTKIDLDTSIDLDKKEYAIESLEGIGPKTGEQFRSIGIATVGDLLRKAHAPEQRKNISETLKIKQKPIDDWASMADLLRINGVTHQFSELMHASGIKTLAELASQNAKTFVKKMETTNAAGSQRISPEIPDKDAVSNWIRQASDMKPIIKI